MGAHKATIRVLIEVEDLVVDAEAVDGPLPAEVATLGDCHRPDRGRVAAIVQELLELGKRAARAVQIARRSGERTTGASPKT